VDNNLKRAQRQLRDMLRKLTSDRLFMGLILLIVLGIIGIIVAKALTGSQASQQKGPFSFF
jgi:uncharacterized membrane protein YeaQ/YmgE (transglycosylase-associated protein family)